MCVREKERVCFAVWMAEMPTWPAFVSSGTQQIFHQGHKHSDQTLLFSAYLRALHCFTSLDSCTFLIRAHSLLNYRHIFFPNVIYKIGLYFILQEQMFYWNKCVEKMCLHHCSVLESGLFFFSSSVFVCGIFVSSYLLRSSALRLFWRSLMTLWERRQSSLPPLCPPHPTFPSFSLPIFPFMYSHLSLSCVALGMWTLLNFPPGGWRRREEGIRGVIPSFLLSSVSSLLFPQEDSGCRVDVVKR